MNYALTAYHMIDWVWAVVDREPADAGERFEKESWISAIGCEPRKKEDVLAWARRECPELELCRQLANATKHLSCRLKKGAVAAAFEVTPTAKWKERRAAEPFLSILDSEQAGNWQLVVVQDGMEVDLVEVLQGRVFTFWSNLTYRIYIGYE